MVICALFILRQRGRGYAEIIERATETVEKGSHASERATKKDEKEPTC
jgi:hypothetical protein